MIDIVRKKSCCFFGHRKIEKTDELKNKILTVTESLIINNDVDTFLFGSKSEFDDFAREIVTELRKRYQHVRRIYVRAEYAYINNSYNEHLLEFFEGSYFPSNIYNAGKAAYVERNREMINKSYYCICYYDESYSPQYLKNKNNSSYYQSKSGTKIAYEYAMKKSGQVINIFQN